MIKHQLILIRLKEGLAIILSCNMILQSQASFIMAHRKLSPPLKPDEAPTSFQWACSLVGAGAGLGWLVLVFCERKTLLAGWFGLAETNKRTG